MQTGQVVCAISRRKSWHSKADSPYLFHNPKQTLQASWVFFYLAHNHLQFTELRDMPYIPRVRRAPGPFPKWLEIFPILNFQAKTELWIDWPFLEGGRQIEIASRAPFPFPTQASVCFKIEMIIFILEDRCQEQKA